MDINQSWIDKFRKYLRGLERRILPLQETLVQLKVFRSCQKQELNSASILMKLKWEAQKATEPV
jgi:hypothetical protein